MQVSHGAGTETRVPAAQSGNALQQAVFEGIVLEPDGAPAEGAVVVSSAGGKAVTDRSGSFQLAVGVPPDAESIRVTAVGRGGRGLIASRNVSFPAVSGPAWVGPLPLAQSPSCDPSWLPGFGALDDVNGVVESLTVFDDGSGGGPELYAGGNFTSAGGVTANRIAKWNGKSWSALGSGTNGFGDALTLHDNGVRGGPPGSP